MSQVDEIHALHVVVHHELQLEWHMRLVRLKHLEDDREINDDAKSKTL